MRGRGKWGQVVIRAVGIALFLLILVVVGSPARLALDLGMRV